MLEISHHQLPQLGRDVGVQGVVKNKRIKHIFGAGEKTSIFWVFCQKLKKQGWILRGNEKFAL